MDHFEAERQELIRRDFEKDCRETQETVLDKLEKRRKFMEQENITPLLVRKTDRDYVPSYKTDVSKHFKKPQIVLLDSYIGARA